MLATTLDIKSFSDQLYQTLNAELDAIARDNQEIISQAGKSLYSIKSAIGKLKTFVWEYEFIHKNEEIFFFKEVKPGFMSQYYYFDKILAVKVNEPANRADTLKAYYNRELDLLQEFIRTHQEFYRYCISDSTQFDEQYFLRTNRLDHIDVDCRFSTGYDNVLAMIHANQKLKEYFQGHIKGTNTESSQYPLTWTGPKTALIELIYALHSVGVLNNGKADIKKIASSLERFFNISVGHYYRQFNDIRLRKNGRTNFVDQMKEKLTQRLDDCE